MSIETKLTDMKPVDFQGAAEQWRKYLAHTLGFDNTIQAEIRFCGDAVTVWLYGNDKFQDRGSYEHRVGQVIWSNSFAMDTAWADVSASVWDKLQKSMRRDERELRHSLNVMGGYLEEVPTYTSAIGQMISERIRAVRDEVTGNLLEFAKARGAVTQPAE
jgi:hypothetical protein